MFKWAVPAGTILGLHSPSIRTYPDIHEGVNEDFVGLECHYPDRSPDDPPTSYPDFVGCLKCHNDPV